MGQTNRQDRAPSLTTSTVGQAVETRAPLAPGRSVDYDDFTDITTTPIDSIGRDSTGAVILTWSQPVPVDVDAAARARIMSQTPAEEALRVEAEAYLNVDIPDEATMREQIQRLTELVTIRPTTLG